MSTWPPDWKERTLGSFAEARGGTSFPLELQGRTAGQLPFYKVSDMNADGNSTWMRRANNYISKVELNKLGGRAFEAKTIAFPKVGATIYTNKKRILASAAVVDNNVMGVTVTDGQACLPEFLFFWFQHIELAMLSSPGTVPSITSARVKAQRVVLPPREEQQQIAMVLSAVQQAIQRQERLVVLTDELKKALTLKLFSEGTRGESLKQTEVGRMPKSWTLERLGSLFSREPSNGLYLPQSRYGSGTLILRIDEFSNNGDVVATASYRVNAEEGDLRRFSLAKDDIVLNRVNSLSHLGKTALIGELREPMLFESNMMRFRVNEKRIRSAFAFRLLNSAVCKTQIIGMAKRAVAQSSVNQGDIGRLMIPLPPDVETQDEILKVLDAVDAKNDVQMRAQSSLDHLFLTLLQQLLGAQIRVHDLDLSALEEADQEPVGAV